MKHILIPTDFSTNSWNAIAYTVQYYQAQVCKFYLLHTHPLRPATIENMSTITLKSIMTLSTIQLQEFKDKIARKYPNSKHSFDTINEFFGLKKAIRAGLNKYPIHKIVMGTKNASKKNSCLLRSNTTHIVDSITSSPIFIVPDNYKQRPIKQILFTTDLNRFYSENEIQLITKITAQHNAVLRVLHIKNNKPLTKIQNYNLSILKKGLSGVTTHYHSIANYNKKETIINDFIKRLDLDLLIMVNYKHNIVQRILQEPTIKKIGIKPIIPFLVIPENKIINKNPKIPTHHEIRTHNKSMV